MICRPMPNYSNRFLWKNIFNSCHLYLGFPCHPQSCRRSGSMFFELIGFEIDTYEFLDFGNLILKKERVLNVEDSLNSCCYCSLNSHSQIASGRYSLLDEKNLFKADFHFSHQWGTKVGFQALLHFAPILFQLRMLTAFLWSWHISTLPMEPNLD